MPGILWFAIIPMCSTGGWTVKGPLHSMFPSSHRPVRFHFIVMSRCTGPAPELDLDTSFLDRVEQDATLHEGATKMVQSISQSRTVLSSDPEKRAAEIAETLADVRAALAGLAGLNADQRAYVAFHVALVAAVQARFEEQVPGVVVGLLTLFIKMDPNAALEFDLLWTEKSAGFPRPAADPRGHAAATARAFAEVFDTVSPPMQSCLRMVSPPYKAFTETLFDEVLYKELPGLREYEKVFE